MILITGGAGYIGSHLAFDLLKKNKKLIIIDNLANGSLKNIKAISKALNKKIKFVKCDILNKKKLERIFRENEIKTIFHLAGFKSISESIDKPLMYYDNNVNCTVNLLSLAKKYKISKIVFSSSATVYGHNAKIPYTEGILSPIVGNPYAMTKLISETLLRDFHEANKFCKIAILRYFNPIGVHKSGKLGYDFLQSSNLIPNIIKVLLKKNRSLKIFGGDFDTADGTGVRDFIHIDDLIQGHTRALQKINMNSGFNIWNLGSGRGYSVLEVVKMFEKILCKKINYIIVKKRKGDLPQFWCDTKKAEKDLNWKVLKSFEDMIKDEINYFKNLSPKDY